MTKARKVQRTQKAGECGKQTKGSGHQEKEGLGSLSSAPSSPCSSKLFTHSLKGNHHLTFLRFFNITFFTNRNMNETFKLLGYKTLYPQMYETNKTRSSGMNIAPDLNTHFVGLVHSVRWSDGQVVRHPGSQSVFLTFCLFVFLPFCLSSSKFILVHWQVDTGTEYFFELTKIVDGIHFNIV